MAAAARRAPACHALALAAHSPAIPPFSGPSQVLPRGLNQILIIVVALSMALTPALAEAGARLADAADARWLQAAAAAAAAAGGGSPGGGAGAPQSRGAAANGNCASGGGGGSGSGHPAGPELSDLGEVG
jgi:uncharacterized membrane protein YgcG